MFHSIAAKYGYWQTPSYYHQSGETKSRRFVKTLDKATKYASEEEANTAMLFNNIDGEVVPNNTPFVKYEPQKATQA